MGRQTKGRVQVGEDDASVLIASDGYPLGRFEGYVAPWWREDLPPSSREPRPPSTCAANAVFAAAAWNLLDSLEDMERGRGLLDMLESLASEQEHHGFVMTAARVRDLASAIRVALSASGTGAGVSYLL